MSKRANDIVEPIEWHWFDEEKPRAGKWVCVIDKNGKFFHAVRVKGTDLMYFAKEHYIIGPLIWAEHPTTKCFPI